MPSRKFSGLSAELQKVRNPAAPTERSGDGRSRGRAPGKRSDPAWAQHTVMLRKATHREAVQIMARQENSMDFSELLDALLADWVKKHQAMT
jgi:hypothetical protein